MLSEPVVENIHDRQLTSGSSLPAHAPPQRILSGTFRATAAVVWIDPGIIQGWLPAGVRFSESRPDPYPLTVMWGSQSEVSAFPGGGRFPIPWRLNYSEIITAVPDLRLEPSSSLAYDGPVTYLPRLYMNSWRAALLGRAFYGFSKAYARIDDSPDSFHAADRRGRPMLTAKVESRATRRVFGGISKRLFDQPVALGTANRLVLGRFEMAVSEEAVQPVCLQIDIQSTLLSHLPEIRQPVGSVDRIPDGAFEFTTGWSLWRVA